MRAVARIKSLPKSVTSVYLLNQDYLFGQSMQKATLKYLAQYRPDIKIVGDELMPFGRCRISRPTSPRSRRPARSRWSLGNYDRDLNLLIKAGVDAGLDIRFDTYLAHLIGWPDSDRRRRRQPADLGDGVPRQRPGRGAQRSGREIRRRVARPTHDFNFIALRLPDACSRCWPRRSTRRAPPTR